jgi:predicted DNA-binding ribbon-helix-helix protein
MRCTRYLLTAERQTLRRACVIFATLQDYFYLATVWCALFVGTSLSCNNWGQWIMKSSVVKRSIVVAGHKTSVSLEDAFWRKLKDIAGERDMTLSDLVAGIDSERQQGNLSSAIRLFVLGFYCDQICQYEARARTGEMLANASVPTEMVRTQAQ